MSSYLNDIIEVPIQNSLESYRLGSLEMEFPEQCVCRQITIHMKNKNYHIIHGIGRDYKIKKSPLIERVIDIKSNAVPMKYP